MIEFKTIFTANEDKEVKNVVKNRKQCQKPAQSC